MNFRSGGFLCAIFLTTFAYAQPQDGSWSLQECVDHALENNIQIRTSALQAEIDKNNLEAARWNYAPGVSASGNVGWNFGLNIDPVTNQISRTSRNTASARVSANWLVFDGGRLYNTIARNNLNYMARLMDLEDVKNDVRLNVASAYLQVMLNREILEVARQQKRISQLQVDQTRKLVEAGSLPMGDLLQFEAQLARDEQNLISSENAVLISKLNLANILQLEDPAAFEIDSPELRMPDEAVIARGPQSIFQVAMDQQPDIEAAQTRIDANEEGVDIAQSSYYPSLSFTGSIGSNYSDQILEPTDFRTVNQPIGVTESNENVFPLQPSLVPQDFVQTPFFQQIEDNVNEFVGINLSVPIFNRMQVKNQVQNARVNLELSKLQLENTKNQLRQTIYQAHADAKASFNTFLAAEKAVESSQASFEYAEDRYEVGAINQFDFENAKNNLAAARSEMLRAKYDYFFKIKVLEFYLTNQVSL